MQAIIIINIYLGLTDYLLDQILIKALLSSLFDQA